MLVTARQFILSTEICDQPGGSALLFLQFLAEGWAYHHYISAPLSRRSHSPHHTPRPSTIKSTIKNSTTTYPTMSDHITQALGQLSAQLLPHLSGTSSVRPTPDFTIPASSANAGSAVHAWTWMNKTGNREMYMNAVSSLNPPTTPREKLGTDKWYLQSPGGKKGSGGKK
jgi:hypothetical protein